MVIQQIDGGLGYYDSVDDSAGNIIMLLNNGTNSLVKTCGYNYFGSIGNGAALPAGNIATPNTIAGSSNIVKIGAIGGGPTSMYALTSTGTLYSWGYNGSGQLGNGNTINQSSPVSVTTGIVNFALSEPQYVNQYNNQLFVQKTDGLVYAAGYNVNGELGIGNTTNQSTLTMVRLPYIASGTWKFGSFSTTPNSVSMVAISPNNTIYSWGYNGNYGVCFNYTNAVTAPIIIELKRGD
jgi:alpha-tubulin suppressor-like RCC1 family protein